MSYWQRVETAAGMAGWYHWVLLGCVVLAFVLAALAPAAHVRIRVAVLLIAASFLGMLSCGIMLYSDALTPEAAAFR